MTLLVHHKPSIDIPIFFLLSLCHMKQNMKQHDVTQIIKKEKMNQVNYQKCSVLIYIINKYKQSSILQETQRLRYLDLSTLIIIESHSKIIISNKS